MAAGEGPAEVRSLTAAWLAASSVVVGRLVRSDVAAMVRASGDGDAGLDGDLVGVGSDTDLDGFAGVGQADLDLLAADHDRPHVAP